MRAPQAVQGGPIDQTRFTRRLGEMRLASEDAEVGALDLDPDGRCRAVFAFELLGNFDGKLTQQLDQLAFVAHVVFEGYFRRD